MDLLSQIIVSVIAHVISHFVCKWFDGYTVGR